MLGRKRSLRSRRQPIANPEELIATPTEHNRVVSPPNLSQRSRDHATSKSRPSEASHDQSIYPQSSAQNPVSESYASPGISEPPEMMIGVALGSPGKSPLPPLPPEDSISWTSGCAELQNPTTFQPNNQEGLYSKASRWKTFGGFFGKRSGLNQASSASSPHPFDNRPSPLGSHRNHDAYQSPPPSVQSSLERHAILHTPSGPPRDWIGPGQLPSPPDRERRTLRKKPSLRRDQLARKQMRDVKYRDVPEINNLTGHWEGSPKPLPKDAPLGSTVRHARAKASLLQVDIPNIELERYSVMFSSLLQPCQQPSTSRQPSPDRQPSLLARRKASLQELRTTPDCTFERPWMHNEHSSSPRAASPHKSPSFSLFPPSPNTFSRRPENCSRERSPLQRSATTPGANSPSKAMFDFSTPSATSPSKAKFDFGTDHTDQVIVIVHTPTEPQPTKPRHPSRKDSSFSSSEAQSFTTARGSPAPEQQQQQAQKSLPTPQSQLRNPSPRRPSPASRSPSEPQRSPSNAPKTAAQTRNPSTHPTTTDDPLREAAEISIARQISISQRQRRLLIAPQPAQPRIVDTSRGEYGAERKSYHSHHLVLEDA
ncbi:MAG: hypothetical protein Q9199_003565 [Rusavskia elegans]